MAVFSSYGITASGAATTLTNVGSQYRETDPWDASTMTWTELVASTPEDWSGFYLSSYIDARAFFYLATGAASSEVTKVGMFSPWWPEPAKFIPLSIPAGTRISCASVAATSVTGYAAITGVPKSVTPNGALIGDGLTYHELGPVNLDGSSSDYNAFVRLTKPTVNNTKSAWTEISRTGGTYNGANNVLNGDSLDSSYKWLGFRITSNYVGNSSQVYKLFDIGYGAAGSEVVAVENLYDCKRANTGAMNYYYGIYWIPWGRAAGDRIAVRYQVSNTSLDGGQDVSLYGIR